MSEETDRKLSITTRDGEELLVPELVAKKSKTIANMLEDLGEDLDEESIPIDTVDRAVLDKVFEFCSHHLQDEDDAAAPDANQSFKPLEGWDLDFVNSMNMKELFDLIMAANFLDIKLLLDVTCKRIAYIVRTTSEKELLAMFGFDTPLTRDEKKAAMKEHRFLMEDCDEIPEMKEIKDEIEQEEQEALAAQSQNQEQDEDATMQEN